MAEMVLTSSLCFVSVLFGFQLLSISFSDILSALLYICFPCCVCFAFLFGSPLSPDRELRFRNSHFKCPQLAALGPIRHDCLGNSAGTSPGMSSFYSQAILCQCVCKIQFSSDFPHLELPVDCWTHKFQTLTCLNLLLPRRSTIPTPALWLPCSLPMVLIPCDRPIKSEHAFMAATTSASAGLRVIGFCGGPTFDQALSNHHHPCRYRLERSLAPCPIRIRVRVPINELLPALSLDGAY